MIKKPSIFPRSSVALLSLMLAFPGLGAPLGRPVGAFDICSKPIVISRENLQKTAALAKTGDKTARICALIDGRSFSEKQLREAGWRLLCRVGDVVTLQGPQKTAPYLAALDGMKMVPPYWRIHLNAADMDSARKESNIDQVLGTASSNLPDKYTGKNVLIGLLDTEFDIYHPAFLDSRGQTRFLALWDQADSVDTAHVGFTYGTMKSGPALQADSTFGLNGEFHGTLIASYAAGSDRTTPYYGAAPDAGIIGVKYTDNIEPDVINGLHWTFHIADSLNLPCVVNMSIGIALGPHDGTSLTDRVIDSMCAKAGHVVVGAMGNDAFKKSHISFSLQSGDSMGAWVEAQVDSLKNPPRAQATSGADIWADTGLTVSAQLYILDKRNSSYAASNQRLSTQTSQTFHPDVIPWNDTIEHKRDTLTLYSLVEKASALNRKPHMEIVLVGPNPNLVLGISFSLKKGESGTVHAWNIEKQAFSGYAIDGFKDGDAVSSLNEIGGTSKKIISLGAYCSKWRFTTWNDRIFDRGLTNDSIWGRICNFSSTGPSIDGRIKPDLCAPGDMVVGAMSQLAPERGQTVIWPDTLSTKGRYTRGTGTSVSSPIAAGIIALMLQADPTLTADEVKQLLVSTAFQDAFTGPLSAPNNVWGAGKINAYGAVAKQFGIRTVDKKGPRVGTSPVWVEVTARGRQRYLALHLGKNRPRSIRAFLFSLSGRMVVCEPAMRELVPLPKTLSKGVYYATIAFDGFPVARQKCTVW